MKLKAQYLSSTNGRLMNRVCVFWEHTKDENELSLFQGTGLKGKVSINLFIPLWSFNKKLQCLHFSPQSIILAVQSTSQTPVTVLCIYKLLLIYLKHNSLLSCFIIEKESLQRYELRQFDVCFSQNLFYTFQTFHSIVAPHEQPRQWSALSPHPPNLDLFLVLSLDFLEWTKFTLNTKYM